MPTIASPLELREGMEADFNCSTPYACLHQPVSLRWQGQDPARSVTSHHEQLEPTGITNQETLHMALSWKDHGRTLSCHLSMAKYKTKGEILLQVQCECRGRPRGPTEHTPAAPVDVPCPARRNRALALRHSWVHSDLLGEDSAQRAALNGSLSPLVPEARRGTEGRQRARALGFRREGP